MEGNHFLFCIGDYKLVLNLAIRILTLNCMRCVNLAVIFKQSIFTCTAIECVHKLLSSELYSELYFEILIQCFNFF